MGCTCCLGRRLTSECKDVMIVVWREAKAKLIGPVVVPLLPVHLESDVCLLGFLHTVAFQFQKIISESEKAGHFKYCELLSIARD